MEKNIFDDIMPQEKLPIQAKEDVFKSIEAAKLLLDIWDLFAPKRVAVSLNTLKQNETNNQKQLENKKPKK